MAKHKILWLPGDGVGPEVSAAAKLVLNAVEFDADYINGDIGWRFWRTEGDALPERTIDKLKDTGTAYFGAITSKGKTAKQELIPELRGKGLRYISPIVRMRQQFDLYQCIRPCKAFKGNPLNYKEDIDLIVFRENTQGLYSGVELNGSEGSVWGFNKRILEAILTHPKAGSYGLKDFEKLTASVRLFDQDSCYRIVKAAFEHAKKHNHKKVTLVEKANVIRQTSGQMVEVGRKIEKEYSGLELEVTNIDAQCMWLVKNPLNYNVLVSSNMFGDIISDLCAQLVGGLGFAYSGNIGDEYAVFEPTAGSAPKYTGMWKMNPIAAILAGKFMLEHLGENEKANHITEGVSKVIKDRKIMTYDMVRGLKKKKQEAGTIDMAVAVIQAMQKLGYVDPKKVKTMNIQNKYKEQIRLKRTRKYLSKL